MTIMLWLVIAAGVLWLAVAAARLERLSDLKSLSGGFRPVLAIAAVVLLVGVFAWLDWGRVENQQRVRGEEPAPPPITGQQIEFRNLRMGVGGPLVQLKGLVRNNHPTYTLTRVNVRLRVLECDAAFRCDTVLGDQTESIAVSVPPQQTGEISHDVFFSGLGPAGLRRSWSHELISVSGAMIPVRMPEPPSGPVI